MASGRDYQRSRLDYTIACICPKEIELAPVRGMLDHIRGFPVKQDPRLPAIRATSDQNVYEFGAIGDHNVVIAIMPGVGNNTAAVIATHLLNDFPAIRFGLLIGIGGGVPNERDDIRLGDVVVSSPSEAHGGVIQYDLGRQLPNGRFQRIGQLDKPPRVLLANVQRLRAHHRMAGDNIQNHLSSMTEKWPHMRAEYSLPLDVPDQLFQASYSHQRGYTCRECSANQVVSRPERPTKGPRIHYGNIGSANMVVKDPQVRDLLGNDEMRILCVEMEAAGLMESFPSLVIRGIADYADTHKSDRWQPYAAAVAAAYMKELLLNTAAADVHNEDHAGEITNSNSLASDAENTASVSSPPTWPANQPAQYPHSPNPAEGQILRYDYSAQSPSPQPQSTGAAFDTLTDRLQQTSLNDPQPYRGNYPSTEYRQPHQSSWNMPQNQFHQQQHQHWPTQPNPTSGWQSQDNIYQGGYSNQHSGYNYGPPSYGRIEHGYGNQQQAVTGYQNYGQYPTTVQQQPFYPPNDRYNVFSPEQSYTADNSSFQSPPYPPWQTSQQSHHPSLPSNGSAPIDLIATNPDVGGIESSQATQTPAPAAPVTRSILIIQCESKRRTYDKDEDLAWDLKEKFTVIVADEADTALEVLEKPHPDLMVIYFYDYDYEERKKREHAVDIELIEAVLNFARQGGTIVINGEINGDKFEPFFKRECRFPWVCGLSTGQTGLIRNRKFNAKTFASGAEPAKRWSPCSLHPMRHVDNEDLPYIAESPRVFENYESTGPVALKKFGEGYIFWFGIGDRDKATRKVFFALLGVT